LVAQAKAALLEERLQTCLSITEWRTLKNSGELSPEGDGVCALPDGLIGMLTGYSLIYHHRFKRDGSAQQSVYKMLKRISYGNRGNHAAKSTLAVTPK